MLTTEILDKIGFIEVDNEWIYGNVSVFYRNFQWHFYLAHQDQEPELFSVDELTLELVLTTIKHPCLKMNITPCTITKDTRSPHNAWHAWQLYSPPNNIYHTDPSLCDSAWEQVLINKDVYGVGDTPNSALVDLQFTIFTSV